MLDNITSLPLEPFYTNNLYNNERRMKLLLFSSILNNIEEFKNFNRNEKICMLYKIEHSCFSETLRKSKNYNIRCCWNNDKFIIIYHNVCYKISSCINIKSECYSTYFINNIIHKKIDLDTIASKNLRELCKDKFEKQHKKINKRLLIKETKKYTTLHFCKKCKKNQTTAKKVQNRSNDEGNSYFITCLNCNNSWFGG